MERLDDDESSDSEWDLAVSGVSVISNVGHYAPSVLTVMSEKCVFELCVGVY